MTNEEFEEWRLIFSVEQLHPANDMRRHAQVMAALHNGPLTRRGKKMWSANEFAEFEPWSKIGVAPKRRKQPTAEQLRAQVAAINARRRH